MQVRLNRILSEKKGQITVFLSLIFLVLMGLAFCILEGMHIYTEVSLSEEVFMEAGDYVLSQYNRPLFERYHLFFLDPEEEEQIVSDGESYMKSYLDTNSSFSFECDNLSVTEEKTAVDEDGLYLKHQIREWMKYREIEKAGEGIKKLFHSMTNVEQKKDTVQKKINAADAAQEGESKAEPLQEETSEEAGLEKENSEGTVSADVTVKEGFQWKQLKETLEQIIKSGILLYVTDDLNQLSALSISGDQLPSQKKGIKKESIINFPVSVTDFGSWKDVLKVPDIGNPDDHFLSDEFFLSEYIFDHFDCYIRKKDDRSIWPRCLQYEVEYLAGGRLSDQENLKLVADKMLLLRFVMNYSFASSDTEINNTAGAMADVLSGVFGLPAAREAVRVLLISAISYGESLLEVHTLFAGGEIAAVKDAGTWNLYFHNAAELLKNREKVKTGKNNVDYKDYLRLLLAIQIKPEKVYYRMMDVMQVNLRLEQPEFLMENCIFRFRWQADMKCAMGSHFYTVLMDRVNSY